MKRCDVECAPQRLPTATFFGVRREREHVVADQCVMEHDIGGREDARRAHRHQVRRTGSRADEPDLGHR
jgi:hypothetical protein